MATAKEKTDKKINKAESIRNALKDLGLDASSKQIIEYVKASTGEDVDAQYVYMQKSDYKKGLDPSKAKKRSRKADESAYAPARSRRKMGNHSNAQSLLAIVKTIRDLVETCGTKQDLIAIIETI